jgi:hypothetical protein
MTTEKLYGMIYIIDIYLINYGARGSLVVKALGLQAGRSRDREPMR